MAAAFRSFSLISAAIFVAIASTACSLPSLETPACTEAKNAVRDFYSFHFGREMLITQAGLDEREKFLTQDFREKLRSLNKDSDPFTTGDSDLPRAFRVGECREITTERTESEVLLFWKDDQRTEQKAIKVETIDVNDTWLINSVSR